MKIILLLALIFAVGISSIDAQAEVTVETDFDVFQQGQMVTITGNAGEKSVTIQVKDPTGISILVRTITTDFGGNFDLQFRIPQTATLGEYQVVATTVVDDSPVINTITFEVVEKGDTVTQVAKEKKGGCLIATAAFGSEMAPHVQFLREIRDNTVLQTESGTSFMAGFNQFYYSF